MKKENRVGIILLSLCLSFISLVFLSNNMAKANDWSGDVPNETGNAAATANVHSDNSFRQKLYNNAYDFKWNENLYDPDDSGYYSFTEDIIIREGDFVMLHAYTDDGGFSASSGSNYEYMGNDDPSDYFCGEFEIYLYEGSFNIVVADVTLINDSYDYYWICEITLNVYIETNVYNGIDSLIGVDGTYYYVLEQKGKELYLTTSATNVMLSGDHFEISGTTTFGKTVTDSLTIYENAYTLSPGTYKITAGIYYSKGEISFIVHLTVSSDTTPPTITCGSNTYSTTTSVTLYSSCTVIFKDNIGLSEFTAEIENGSYSDKEISGTSYTYGSLLEGGNLFTVYDTSGNYTEVLFTLILDTTAPVIKCGSITLSSSSTSPSYSKSCSLVFTDNKALSQYEIYGDVTDAISGTKFTYGTLSTEGSYKIIVKDATGNTTTGYLVIDNTAPSVTCGGTVLSTSSSSPTYKNASCSLIITDNQALLGVTVSETLSAYEEYTSLDSAGTSYTYGTLSDEGIYEILVSDKTGNGVSVYLTIDKTKPVWYTSNVSTISSGSSISFQLTEEKNQSASSGIYDCSSPTQYMYAWNNSTSAPSYSSFVRTFTSNTAYNVSFTTTAPIVSEQGTYYLWIYNVGKDNADNVATYSGKVPDTSMSFASSYLRYSYTILPPTMSNIFATASISNGKITFTKATSNSIQEAYKNGTIRYFIGKPDLYDSNLSDAFDKYGVSIAASSFFTSSLVTPQGLIGEVKLYVELSGTNLATIFTKSRSINITNSGNSTITFALELETETPVEEESTKPVTLSTSNIVIKENITKSNYMIFVSMIIISSLLAIEVIVIKKHKKAHN